MPLLPNIVERLLLRVLSKEAVREWLLTGLDAADTWADKTEDLQIDDFAVQQAREAVLNDEVYEEIYQYTIGLAIEKLAGERMTMAAPAAVPPVVWAILAQVIGQLLRKWLD